MTSLARHGRRGGGATSRARAPIAIAISAALAALVVGSGMVTAQTADDPSEVVLVFDVSDSILDSDDGTNVEFAAALEGIADRVGDIADDLVVGNSTVSFVAFGRTAKPYPAGCQRLQLHADPDVVARFEDCLRRISAEYAAGSRAPVKERINTAGTDHVAALREAADLLRDVSSRSAVVFFTDGEHDPPGTSRDGENVVAEVTPAYAGRRPLAILPVGLGRRAGKFEADLGAIYQGFLRDMAPCEGRPTFAWPEVVFASGNDAGAAVALALQEVTCSFTVAPTPSLEPSPATAPPLATAAPVVTTIPDVPGQPRAEPLDGAARLTVDPAGGSPVERYIFECTGATGQTVRGEGPESNVVVNGLANGETFQCVAYAQNRIGRSAASVASAAFSPCGGLFACNPWLLPVLSAVAIAALLAGVLIVARRVEARRRIWVTAQIDGGANRPLGWGRDHGIGLERDDAGWYATPRPLGSAQIRIHYEGRNRFVVHSPAGIRNVHQGDPAQVREGTGPIHQLTIRLYRQQPRELTGRPSSTDEAGADALGARLGGGTNEG
jgi:hypothetical protein